MNNNNKNVVRVDCFSLVRFIFLKLIRTSSIDYVLHVATVRVQKVGHTLAS